MMFLAIPLRFLFKLVSKLPLGLLYGISDLLSPLINHVFKYRKRVISENLQKSFPGKDAIQIKTIIKDFYHYLTDLIFEIIKLESISETELFSRVTISGNHVLRTLSEKQQGVVLVMSHSGNWEWICQRVSFEGRYFEYVGVIAKEISNPHFNEYFTKIRLRLQKGHADIIPFTETARNLAAIRHKTSLIITIADQTPHISQIQYRTSFLNQDSGVFLGPERIAKSLNYAVVFCHVNKIGRGKYNIEFELITDSPKENPGYYITNRHVKMLEEDIIRQPEIWLWSHRRWKY
jgi:Kdo2-lipid IVA lauroyltransferase/acyltransferase